MRRFEEVLEGSVDVEGVGGVLKYDVLSDGFVVSGNISSNISGNNGQQPLHISGGLFHYLLVLLNSTPQVHHTPD